jgi:hypothetical protein
MIVEGRCSTVVWMQMRQFAKLLQHGVVAVKGFYHLCSWSQDFNDATVRGELAKSGYLERSFEVESDKYLRLEIYHEAIFGVARVHALPLLCAAVATWPCSELELHNPTLRNTIEDDEMSA